MNPFSILAATVAGMVLGALWYSPIGFGRAWLAAIGKSEDELGSATGPMIGSVVACLVTALAIAWLVRVTGFSGVVGGVVLGMVLGPGLVATAMLSDSLFCGWGTRLYFIQAGYRVLYIVVMAVIIAAWPF